MNDVADNLEMSRIFIFACDDIKIFSIIYPICLQNDLDTIINSISRLLYFIMM